MSSSNSFGLGIVALSLLGATPVIAQGQDAHAGHHPTGTPAAPPPASSAPTTGEQSRQQTSPHAMGVGQRGQGSTPRSGMSMCSMMMGQDMNMSAAVDKRIPMMRQELAITPAQSGAWDTYAHALRAVAANMDKLHGEMMAGSGSNQSSPVAGLDRHDRMLGVAQENIRTLRPALARLYGELSAEQKLRANTILGAHGGMMAPMADANMMRR